LRRGTTCRNLFHREKFAVDGLFDWSGRQPGGLIDAEAIRGASPTKRDRPPPAAAQAAATVQQRVHRPEATAARAPDRYGLK